MQSVCLHSKATDNLNIKVINIELLNNELKQDNAGAAGCAACIACTMCFGCAVCGACLAVPLLGAGIIAAEAAAVATSVTGAAVAIGVATL